MTPSTLRDSLPYEEVSAQLEVSVGSLKTQIHRLRKQYAATIREEKSLSEIGRELSVTAILESSVERIDNRVRIITGLYDAATNKRLWGASYDREIKDIFAIQSDVAEQIAAALRAGLSADERASINQKPTENVAAYDFYLRGWGLYQLYQNDDNEKAIDLFKQAIEADPKFALAYTGLADAYIERVQRFHGQDFWSDSAVDLCQRAVALDPKEVRSYTELARAFINKMDAASNQCGNRSASTSPDAVRALGASRRLRSGKARFGTITARVFR